MALYDEAIIIPDTNAFLEFQFFTDVDWADLAGAKRAQLVIVSTILRELDRWKRERGRRRERAATVLRRLLHDVFQDLALSVGDIRSNVSVVLWPDDPSSVPPADVEDDRLLAVAEEIARRNPGCRVVLATDDTTVLLKARARSLVAVLMPEHLRLPEEPSEERRELQRLRVELEEMKSRSPVLELMVEGPAGPASEITVPIRVPSPPTGADIQARVAEASVPYDKALARLVAEFQGTRSTSSVVERLLAGMRRKPTATEVDYYRKALNDFQAGYPQYLEGLHEWSKLRGRSARLQFTLTNTGRAEAEAVDIILHFPDDVSLKRELKAPPEPPSAPREPDLSLLGGLSAMAAMRSVSLPTSLLAPPGARFNPSIPRIRQGSSVELTYGSEDVRHGFAWRPGTVWIVFPEGRTVDSFEVPYTLSARNLPEVVHASIRITPVYEHAGPWLPPND